ncbi:MAG: disulfide bond formation protein B [Pseudomonadota bacterium]
MFDRRQKINLAGALISFGMVGYAIYTEKYQGLLPCPLCMFQRVCIGALGLVFLIAALHRSRTIGGAIYALLIFISAGAASWVAGRHFWIQHQPPGTVPACGAPLDNLLQMFPLLEVVRKVMTGGGECGHVDWQWLGISMPGWVFIMAVTLGLVGILNNLVSPYRSRY